MPLRDILKDLEPVFTVLIACSAALAGIAGYMATSANSEASDATQNAQWYINEANTIYLENSQYYLRDIDLLNQANLADYEGNPDVGEYMREMTYMYQLGYINSDGTAPSEYADYDAAFAAYYEELYALYNNYYDIALVEYDNASLAAERGDTYLLTTVILAISATFGTVGLTVNSPSLKKVFLVLVALFIAVSLLILAGA